MSISGKNKVKHMNHTIYNQDNELIKELFFYQVMKQTMRR